MLRFRGFTGVRGTATGLRQATTQAGREFWVAGIAARNYGIVYFNAESPDNATVIHGARFTTKQTPLQYEPATLDVRGLMVSQNQLIMSSSYLVERNRNMPSTDDFWASATAWGGIIRVVDDDDGQGAPRTRTRQSRLATGFTGRRNFWTFIYEHPRSLWMLEDIGVYTLASEAGVAAFQTAMQSLTDQVTVGKTAGPVLMKGKPSTLIVNWQFNGYRWREPAIQDKTRIRDACYSITGRNEATVPSELQRWIVYTASRTKLYRVNPQSRVVKVLLQAQSGYLFRGVSIPIPAVPTHHSANIDVDDAHNSPAKPTYRSPMLTLPSRTTKPKAM